MTYEEFECEVARRRSITGGSWTDAAKKLLEHYYNDGVITEAQYYEFKEQIKYGH